MATTVVTAGPFRNMIYCAIRHLSKRHDMADWLSRNYYLTEAPTATRRTSMAAHLYCWRRGMVGAELYDYSLI